MRKKFRGIETHFSEMEGNSGEENDDDSDDAGVG